jgi:hypothetical protein
MAAAIKGSPYVIQLLGQWEAYPSLFTPNDRYVDNNTIQIDEHAGILPAPEDFKPRTCQSTESISILLSTVLYRTNYPQPPWLLRHLWVQLHEPPHIT